MKFLGAKSLNDTSLQDLRRKPYMLEWMYLNIVKDEEEEFRMAKQLASYQAMFSNPELWKKIDEQEKAEEDGVMQRAEMLAAQGPSPVDPDVAEFLKKRYAPDDDYEGDDYEGDDLTLGDDNDEFP